MDLAKTGSAKGKGVASKVKGESGPLCMWSLETMFKEYGVYMIRRMDPQ